MVGFCSQKDCKLQRCNNYNNNSINKLAATTILVGGAIQLVVSRTKFSYKPLLAMYHFICTGIRIVGPCAGLTFFMEFEHSLM